MPVASRVTTCASTVFNARGGPYVQRGMTDSNGRFTRWRRVAPLAALALAVGLAACHSAAESSLAPTAADADLRGRSLTPTPGPTGQTLPYYFPPTSGAAWDTISPARLNYDTTALRAALDWAGTQRSTAAIVLWRGRIVAERYWHGWTPDKDSIIASASKSVLSTIVGEMARTGRIALDSSVTYYLGAGWSRSPVSEARITVRHLLGMMSGLDDSLKYVVPPGTRFYYNSPAYYKLFNVVQAVSGQNINQLSRTMLFDKIGMSSALWVPNIESGTRGWILTCTPREMARFGLLTLARGAWNGTPVLADSAWFRIAWHQLPPDNQAYGYLWWLNGGASYRIPGPYLLPTLRGMLIPSAPRDLVAALGKGDKKIYVIPSLDLVVVRHGEEADTAGGNPMAVSSFDEQWWQRLKRAFRY